MPHDEKSSWVSQISFALPGSLCEPPVLSIPKVFRVRNCIIITWYESCVRLVFSSDFMCVRACVRVNVCVGRYRALFFYASIRIRNNPPCFSQNTITGSVRIIIIIHCGNLLNELDVYSNYGETEAPRYCAPCRKSHLLFRALCACEPPVLSIPNGISRTERYSSVVRILLPFNF